MVKTADGGEWEDLMSRNDSFGKPMEKGDFFLYKAGSRYSGTQGGVYLGDNHFLVRQRYGVDSFRKGRFGLRPDLICKLERISMAYTINNSSGGC